MALKIYGLDYACADDIFIFIRFTTKIFGNSEWKYVSYAEDCKDAKMFICYTFLNDLIMDAMDDLEFDFKKPFDKRQEDVITLMNFWYKLSQENDLDLKTLKNFCKKFNEYFKDREDIQYEIQVLNGVIGLRRFIDENYSDREKYDKQKLWSLCDTNMFSGAMLKEYLDIILN